MRGAPGSVLDHAVSYLKSGICKDGGAKGRKEPESSIIVCYHSSVGMPIKRKLYDQTLEIWREKKFHFVDINSYGISFMFWLGHTNPIQISKHFNKIFSVKL